MTRHEELNARAWEYALGLLSEEGERQAELEMETDDAFRLAVSAATAQLHKLDLTAAPETVPPRLWDVVSERIADMPQMPAPTAGPSQIVPVNAVRRIGPHSLGSWQVLAMAASLVAACAIGYFGGVAMTTAPQPVVVVVLDTAENVPGAVFEAYADDSIRIVPLEDFVVPEGQVMQVWTLYDRSVGPVSLGTIGRRATEMRLQGPHLPEPRAEQLYEITLEPSPGSPTGKPTGPILVKGFAREVRG
jgi:anti-sigma-K factor RskA